MQNTNPTQQHQTHTKKKKKYKKRKIILKISKPQQNTKAYKTWAAIAFKFNENKIAHMEQLAKKYNFEKYK